MNQKIGILTFFKNLNKGAMLQAQSLQKAVQKLAPDADVEIIDFNSRAHQRSIRKKVFFTRRVHRIPKRWRDYRLCKQFGQQRLKCSRESLVSDNYAQVLHWLNSLSYDIIFVGSDEVWKAIGQVGGGGNNAGFERPFPNIYFLGPSIKACTSAYAASSNKTDMETFTNVEKSELQNLLKSFDYIAVRDDHTASMLRSLGISKFIKVPDPTILEKPRGDQSDRVLARFGVSENDRLIGLDAYHVLGLERLCDSYRRRGFKIISPSWSPCADVNLEGYVTAEQYFDLYRHFDMVITTSLHSTIFSAIQGTPFLTLDALPAYSGLESKTTSLLRDLDLLDRHFNVHLQNQSGLYAALEQAEAPLPTKRITELMDAQRAVGISYLETVLKGQKLNNTKTVPIVGVK